jgi:RNA-directed DNA polymerase
MVYGYLMPEPTPGGGKLPREAEEYCHRGSPPEAYGESYHAEYSEVGKAHYRGKGVTGVRRPHRTLLPDTVGSEHQKPTALRGRANTAKADPRHRVRALSRGLNVAFLLDCWSDLNKAAASGVAGETWQTYAENLHANVESLGARLKAKRSRAKLVRRPYIPKANGKARPLGMPVVEDKLRQAAVARILTALYEPEFLACSYGYRPARGAAEAVRDLPVDLQYGCYG